jgi:Zn-finger nucleic acid-binding protein
MSQLCRYNAGNGRKTGCGNRLLPQLPRRLARQGELDKIIEKATAQENTAATQQPNYQTKPMPQYQHKDAHEYYKHKPKQKNWLSELFD